MEYDLLILKFRKCVITIKHNFEQILDLFMNNIFFILRLKFLFRQPNTNKTFQISFSLIS